ncbi:MAG: McrC family protein [Spirochaetota bacterium]|nr:McrC family protein [Spirochaetota bacterium]
METSEWLFDILAKGKLLDNQTYVAQKGEFSNYRFADDLYLLKHKEKGHHTKPYNNEEEIWKFLIYVSSDFKEKVNKNTPGYIVLFNDKNYEHNTDDGLIHLSGNDARNFKLKTGNLIGYIKCSDYSLKISSRFGDQFLRYIISDAEGFLELKDSGGESYNEGYEWLLAYIWNIKLKRAYRLGLPKKYIQKKESISRVRGTIDCLDYYRNKTSGKYLCKYREHSYQNAAVKLYIEAYKAIEKYSFCQETRNIYNTFLTINQGTKRTLKELLNTPHFKNPFYQDYNVLIDLSKQVLKQGGFDFDDQHDSSAYLFDISMLFEYFIRKLINRSGIHLLSKQDTKHTIPSGILNGYKRSLEPDLVINTENGVYIFDVKYKSFDFKYGVKREDLFQLHTYLGQYSNTYTLKGCGFIYPISENRWEKKMPGQNSGLIQDVIKQQNIEIPFYVLFLIIPNDDNTNFLQSMSNQCEAFVKNINKLILK